MFNSLMEVVAALIATCIVLILSIAVVKYIPWIVTAPVEFIYKLI